MRKTISDISLIIAATLLITFLVWLPHLLSLPNFWGLNFSNGFNTIYRNFDGLEYVIIAKTFYYPDAIAALPQDLPANYFAAHFPGYSLAILLLAPFLGFLKSMLATSLIFTILSIIIFYQLIKEFKLSSQPLYLSLLFLIIPSRWLIVHSVGSSEPMFIFLILSTIYFLMKYEISNKYYLLAASAISALLAQITRPPGALLLIALFLYISFQLFKKSRETNFAKEFFNYLKYSIFIIALLGLLGIFYWYGLSYNDFWAYFHSGDNIHLTFPPFQVFNKYQAWVGDIWLEDIVLTFTLVSLGGTTLLKKKLYPMAFFVLTYLIASIFVAHRDISRYILPVAPFILIAFEKILTSKEFKIILPLIALATYLYTQNFIIENTAPIPNPFMFN